jgi:hypothetical protein
MIGAMIEKCLRLSVQSAGKLFSNLRREEKGKWKSRTRGGIFSPISRTPLFLLSLSIEATLGRSCRFRMPSADDDQVNREDQRQPEEATSCEIQEHSGHLLVLQHS